jgi:hypothetical protein
LVPDVEKMPHQSENFLAGQQVDRLSAADGAGNRSFHQSPVEKADSGRRLEKWPGPRWRWGFGSSRGRSFDRPNPAWAQRAVHVGESPGPFASVP